MNFSPVYNAVCLFWVSKLQLAVTFLLFWCPTIGEAGKALDGGHTELRDLSSSVAGSHNDTNLFFAFY
jgi:hypothetical protein